MQQLFPESFLAAFGGLKMDIRPAPPRAAQGAHLSPRPGASLEFRDYQSYTPGDDLRRVDWNVYARTRHLFVRRFEHPSAVPVILLVDASESMRLETPPRYAAAARVAAAITASALASQNPVHVMIAAGGVAAMPKPVTGRRGLVRVLAELAADRQPGSAGVADGIRATLPLLSGRQDCVVVILSDFFEQRGVEALVESLRLMPGRLALVRITQPWDAEPALAGDFELADCESGATLRVVAGTSTIARYQDAYRSYFGVLDDYLSLRGGSQYSIDASQDTLPQLERLFPNGILRI